LRKQRIKLRSRAAPDFGNCRLDGQGRAIRSVSCHRIKAICKADDAAQQGNFRAHQTARVAFPVHSFMVMQYSWYQIAYLPHVIENVCTDLRVLLECDEFLVSELSGLGQYRVRDSDLAHVMQQSRQVHTLAFVRIETGLLCDEPAEKGYTLGMAAGVRI